MPHDAVGGQTREIAGFVASARLDALPAAVRQEARRALLNIVGCMVGGSRHPAVDRAERALAPFGGAAQATVVGRGLRSDVLTAALLNGLSSAVHIYDDTHAEAMIHPSGPIAAAALALAEHRAASGADLLLAMLLGVEVACRLSKAISVPPAEGSIAWSQTGVCGTVGAAVAAGRLLGLDADGLVRAIGIAASQSAGLRAMHGSMCTPLMPGHAAQAGLRSALLAEAGFTSSTEALEHRYGLMACFADRAAPAALTDALGDRFELMANTYKPFPCGIVIHPMIDASLQIAVEDGIEAAAIGHIDIVANPKALALCDRPEPLDEYDAFVSLQHWTAAAFVHRRAGVREGADAVVADPAVAALRRLIAVRADPGIGQDSVDLVVTLHDGTTVGRKLRHCLGSAGRPMTDRDLEAKFEALAEGILSPVQTADLIGRLRQVDGLADAGELARLAA